MKDKKENKTQSIINFLENKSYYVEVNANGHIKVLDVDFWCTTEKWWHGKANKKGLGLPSFVKYLEELQVIDDGR